MRAANRAASLALFAAFVALLGSAGCERSLPPDAFDPVRTAGGLTVYLGVLPGALIRGHDAGTPAAMHGGARTTPATHHVTVAVFDAATGARITDAIVTAAVSERLGAPTTRRLERMTVAGALTYGNFFTLSSGDAPVTIGIRIERGGRAPVQLQFAYRHGP